MCIVYFRVLTPLQYLNVLPMQQSTIQDPNFVNIRVRTRQMSIAIVSFEIIEFVVEVQFEADGLDGC